MSTVTAHLSRGAARRTVATALVAVGAIVLLSGSTAPSPAGFVDDDDAPGSALPVSVKPKADAVEAVFGRRGYRPGDTATLRVTTRLAGYELQVFHAGYGSDGPMRGKPVSPPVRQSGSVVAVRVGTWPSGLYYARLTTKSSYGYAPFVVSPARLGEHRVAVVLPTNTWQAYNFFDANGDGRPDSWYGNPESSTVDLSRPFIDRGVPPHYTGYDRGFIRWLALHHEQPDFLTDDDLEQVGRGDVLARTYDLVVFSGHEEYVTQHEYDVTERYRDLGGNLMFLSANNFFYRVDRHGDQITRTGRWRDQGRPEARLIGIQYVDWYQERYRNQPYTVTGAARADWAFRGTGLRNGTRFGVYGIEIDARSGDSPQGIQVLARIPNIFGPGKSAEMTYYTTPRGAKVFAAGVINFGGSSLWPGVRGLVENLWKELSRP
jgi:N,N-dimethylformamidase beta subunit-like, C-terminal